MSLRYDRDFDVRETDVRVLDDVIVLAGIMLGHSRLDGEQQVFHFPCIGVWRKDFGDGECSPGSHRRAVWLSRRGAASPAAGGHLAALFCIKWGSAARDGAPRFASEDEMSADHVQLEGPDLSLGVKLSAIPDGAMLKGHVDDQAVVLVRRGDELFAVGAKCPHYGGPLAEGVDRR